MFAFVTAFVVAGINPMGGMFVAIPIAIFKLDWPAWLAVVLSVPLAFVQVVAVDLLWDRLQAWPTWVTFLEKKRSAHLERLLARSDAGLWLTLIGPWLGPWLVMAVARFGGHGMSRVALPLIFGLTYVAIGTATICVAAPAWLPR